MAKRGKLIVFEGLDRMGKTTQVTRLAKRLSAHSIRFPNRQGRIAGPLFQSVLSNGAEEKAQAEKMEPTALHLLFMADRWQEAPKIEAELAAGRHVVVDRFSFSGTAFAMAQEHPKMNWDWVLACEKGLPVPDVVLVFLPRATNTEDKKDENHDQVVGTEKFESTELQNKVRARFDFMSHLAAMREPKPLHWVVFGDGDQQTPQRLAKQTQDEKEKSIAAMEERIWNKLVELKIVV